MAQSNDDKLFRCIKTVMRGWKPFGFGVFMCFMPYSGIWLALRVWSEWDKMDKNKTGGGDNV